MAETLFSPGISLAEADQSAVAAGPVVAGAAIVGPTVKGPVLVPTKVTSYNEYVRVFGTTFQGTDMNSTGSAVQQEFMTSLAAKSYFEQGGESLLVVRAASNAAFTVAKSTNIAASSSSAAAPFEIYTLGAGALYNSNDNETAIYTSSAASGALANGTEDNVRFEIANINEDAGTFTLVVRRGDDDANSPVVLETWNNVSLDPYSTNYIAAVIGDQYNTYNATDAVVEPKGEYINKSAYIRVKVLNATPNYNPATDAIKLPAVQQGAFYSATGVVGTPYSGSTTGSASEVAYFQDIATSTKYPQSVLPSDYGKAISLLANVDEYEINILSAPGLVKSNTEAAAVVDQLVAVCQDRGDCVAVVDTVTFAEKLEDATAKASTINSSYAATYWPWLQTYASTGRAVWVPASVVIPGVYAYNDNQTAPWYAPAGMTRGGISAIQAAKKLTKANRDALYLKNVNPIATLPGAGLVIYGQKTLQKKASALDRVNVRRLMIEVKKKVKDLASGLLFEQNTVALQNNFRSKLDPYLASIVQRNGLYNYAINLDGNTSEAVDRGEFHCSIALQPTRTVEYVYINFVINATGVEFA